MELLITCRSVIPCRTDIFLTMDTQKLYLQCNGKGHYTSGSRQAGRQAGRDQWSAQFAREGPFLFNTTSWPILPPLKHAFTAHPATKKQQNFLRSVDCTFRVNYNYVRFWRRYVRTVVIKRVRFSHRLMFPIQCNKYKPTFQGQDRPPSSGLHLNTVLTHNYKHELRSNQL